jgi:hypothetical protein
MMKRQVATKGAVGATKHPRARRAGVKAAKPVAKASVKVAKPIVKRKVRRRVEPIREALRTAGALVATYGPPVAIEFGLIDVPKRKRTGPRVAVGVLIGATAMYFLDPTHGSERRQKLFGAAA